MADRSTLILDIETVPDPALPWDAARDGFPPPTHHQIVAIGALWFDGDGFPRRHGVFGNKPGADAPPSETQNLRDFVEFVGRERCHLVTFGGRTFDLPVLVNRCLKHGIAFQAYFTDRDYRYRYSDMGHLDLADLLSEHGAVRRPTLRIASRLMGLGGNDSVDGSMVAGLYAKGQLETIRAHCLRDVLRTAFLFLRFERLRGRLDRHAYHARALRLFRLAEDDRRLADVVARADRATLLLE